MIRIMKYSDLAQCGRIYAKAFPMEHWGIDWTTENATEYLKKVWYIIGNKKLKGTGGIKNEEICLRTLWL